MKLGDIVHFYPDTSDELSIEEDGALAALVVWVHDSGMVNLAVFSPFGRTAGRHQVRVYESRAVAQGNKPWAVSPSDDQSSSVSLMGMALMGNLTLPGSAAVVEEPQQATTPPVELLPPTTAYSDGTTATGSPGTELPQQSPQQQDSAEQQPQVTEQSTAPEQSTESNQQEPVQESVTLAAQDVGTMPESIVNVDSASTNQSNP